jgi:uncharacterized Rossmann fold enzyme
MDELLINKIKGTLKSAEDVLSKYKHLEEVELKLRASIYLDSAKFDRLLKQYDFSTKEVYITGKKEYLYRVILTNNRHTRAKAKAQHFIDKGVFNDVVTADVFTDIQEIILNKKNKSSIYIVSCFDENRELLFEEVKEILIDRDIKINYRSNN